MYKKVALGFMLICFFIVLLAPKSPSELYCTHIGKAIRPLLTQPWASHLAGWYCSTRFSRIHIPGFIKKYHISMHESARFAKDFKTFNDFFTRELKLDARPIDSDEWAFICPADCYVTAQESIQRADHFPVKEVSFTLARCLASQELADAYEGGAVISCRLAPWQYHRFHFPCTGTPSALSRITGSYESVDPITYLIGIQPLEVNERGIIHIRRLQSPDILMIPVGALFVGSIRTTYQPEKACKKGQEAGCFAFGGSTVLLVVPKGCMQIDPKILMASKQGIEVEMKMGQAIGTFTPKN